MRLRAAFLVGVLVVASSLAFAQGRRWWRDGGELDALRGPARNSNVPYDGRFTFVRLNYTTLPGGYWYRGQPAWSHGYPEAEYNLMRILDGITTLRPHINNINTLSLEDPEIFKYPVLYVIEAGWWDMTDAEAAALRGWDYQLNAASREAAVYMSFFNRLIALTFHDDVPEDFWPGGGGSTWLTLRKILPNPTAAWWDNAQTDGVEGRDDIFRQALALAADEQQRRTRKWCVR